jgi:hypothetical protein
LLLLCGARRKHLDGCTELSREAAEEHLKGTQGTAFVLRLGEGRIEVIKVAGRRQRVSYGLNLVLSCKRRNGVIAHEPLVDIHALEGCAVFLDNQLRAQNNLDFLWGERGWIAQLTCIRFFFFFLKR